MAEEAEEQEGQETEGEAGPAPAPPKKSKFGQFVVLALIILVGQAAAVYFLVNKSLLPKLRPEEAEDGQAMATANRADVPEIPIDVPFLFPLATGADGILVNPVDPIMIRFLSAQVMLQMNSQEGLDEISDPVKARKVREVVRRTLANMRFDKLDAPEEREAMRDTVKFRINRSLVLEIGEVESVFFPMYVLN